MRTAFIQQLLEEASADGRVFLVVGDLGYNVVEPFRDRFPDRFLNAGIAEQNMIGVAAGLAKEGFIPYVYSIANFPTLRCMEQIRYDVAYHGLPVRIVSVGAGYAYASLGASHHATEDVGMMRSIPSMAVCTPGDPLEARAITSLSVGWEGPMYIRLGKAGEKVVHQGGFPGVAPGVPVPVEVSGRPALVMASGAILAYCAERIRGGGVDADLYSLPFVKPLSDEAFIALAERYGEWTVVEEHQKSCGAGSAVVEKLSDLYCDGRIPSMPKLRRVAINDTFCAVSGSQASLREMEGLTL